MAVLKWMLKLALFPLLLLLILAQWVGIFLTTFSTILTNLLAGLFFFVALTSWVMKLADGGEVLKMLITAFVVFVLPYIAIAAIAKISFFAEEHSGIFSNPEFKTVLRNARRSFCYIGSAQGRPFFNMEVQAYETDV